MEWVRATTTLDLAETPLGRVYHDVAPLIRLRTREAAGPLRVGVWSGPTLMTGWSLPFLPADATLLIDGTKVTGTVGAETKDLRTFVRGWDERRFPRPVTLPYGRYDLTIDQQPDRVVDVLVDVHITAVGS